MKRLLPWLAPVLVLSVGAAYLLNPSFSLAFNQLCEMLATGNVRGLLMFFHGAGPKGWVLSLGAGIIAFLIPALKPMYLLQANGEFFGQTAGTALAALSGITAAVFLALLGLTLFSIMPASVQQRLRSIPYLRGILLSLAVLWLVLRL